MKSPMQNPQNSGDSARLMLAVAVSLAILMTFHFAYERPQAQKMQAAQEQKQKQAPAPQEVTPPAVAVQQTLTRPAALAASTRVLIRSEKLTGSIALKGARLDDLRLNGRYETIARQETVALLSPSGTPDAYYIEGGWAADNLRGLYRS